MATQVLPEPVSTYHKIDFSSNGDTTNQAFSKHILEIERIYGYLKALDLGKVSADDVSGLSGSLGNISTSLTNHINSTNPHPNWKPSVNWSDLTGTKPNLADFGGNLDASKVSGKLSNANIDTSGVNGLKSFVEGLIPSGGGSTDKGDGITDSSLASNGYAKFNNGLIIQWGKSEPHPAAASVYTDNFPTSFSSACYAVIPTGKFPITTNDLDATITGWNTTGYQVRVTSSNTPSLATAYVYYIAIGR